MQKLVAGLLLIAGGLFIANAAFPIVGYEFLAISKFGRQDTLLSPLARNKPVLGITATSDFTRASNWFDVYNNDETPPSPTIRYYSLSIPKLKIDQATVEIYGEDLAKNLIQYKGTGLPGKNGNTVIFGHSALPQFYSSKNYLTIFTQLPTLKVGDAITVDYDGITYTYKVSDMFEAAPNETEVLRQYSNGSHLTLITCVPPGTYLKRLVVRANLVIPQ